MTRQNKIVSEVIAKAKGAYKCEHPLSARSCGLVERGAPDTGLETHAAPRTYALLTMYTMTAMLPSA